MSHIQKAYAKTRYTNKEFLIKALSHFGRVLENDRLYEVGNGLTRKKFSLVLVDHHNSKKRLGFNEVKGVWQQYQENWGSIGEWSRQVTKKVNDRYLAYHYERELQEEGYSITINESPNGELEVVGLEAAW